MDAGETKATVESLDKLRHRSRRDRRATSLPLLVFGLITLLGAPSSNDFGRGRLYWVLALPLGFGLLFAVQRIRAARTGVGEGREPYGWFALGWLILLLPVGVMLAFLAPVAAIAAGLIAVAVHQRNLYLALCALIYGVVGTLEFPWSAISNRLYDLNTLINGDGYLSGHFFDWSSPLVAVLLAAFLLIAGAIAWRRETRSA